MIGDVEDCCRAFGVASRRSELAAALDALGARIRTEGGAPAACLALLERALALPHQGAAAIAAEAIVKARGSGLLDAQQLELLCLRYLLRLRGKQVSFALGRRARCVFARLNTCHRRLASFLPAYESPSSAAAPCGADQIAPGASA